MEYGEQNSKLYWEVSIIFSVEAGIELDVKYALLAIGYPWNLTRQVGYNKLLPQDSLSAKIYCLICL